MATYVILGLVAMTLLLLWAVPRGFRISKPWILTTLLLCLLTAVFDNLIIKAGIVEYNPQHYLGIMIGYAPIEDFFYPVAAAVIIAVLWHNETHD